MILGRGAYGEVRVQSSDDSNEDIAVKSYTCKRDLDHGRRRPCTCIVSMVHEYTALMLTRECTQLVNAYNIDYENIEISLDLYDNNLKKYMTHNNLSGEDRLEIIKSMLLALSFLENMRITHCDVKLSNILVKRVNGKLITVLGDLGLMNSYKYAPVSHTTLSYRESRPIADDKHDIYSLGIVIYELITDSTIKSQMSLQDMRDNVRELKRSDPWRKILLSVFRDKRRERPSARDILSTMFNMKTPYKHLSCPKDLPSNPIVNWKINGKVYNGRLDDVFMSLHSEVKRERRVYLLCLLEELYSQDEIDTLLFLTSCIFNKKSIYTSMQLEVCHKKILHRIMNSQYLFLLFT